MPHILIIDDHREIRLTTARLLAAEGYRVTEAGTGAEGLRLWRDFGADLVITDIHMPEVDGVGVIRQLRAEAPTLPIIVMSGSIRARDLERLRASELLGTVAVIQKPFGWNALSDAITSALGSGGLPS